jgi:hypothetical protein
MKRHNQGLVLVFWRFLVLFDAALGPKGSGLNRFHSQFRYSYLKRMHLCLLKAVLAFGRAVERSFCDVDFLLSAQNRTLFCFEKVICIIRLACFSPKVWVIFLWHANIADFNSIN